MNRVLKGPRSPLRVKSGGRSRRSEGSLSLGQFQQPRMESDPSSLPLLRMTRRWFSRSRLSLSRRSLLSCRTSLLRPANRHDAGFGGDGVGARGGGDRLARLLVDEPLAFVVPEDHLVFVDLLDVLGQERNLAAASWCVDHEVRNGEAAASSRGAPSRSPNPSRPSCGSARRPATWSAM